MDRAVASVHHGSELVVEETSPTTQLELWCIAGHQRNVKGPRFHWTEPFGIAREYEALLDCCAELKEV